MEKNRFSAFHSFLALKRFRFTFHLSSFRFAFTMKTEAYCTKHHPHHCPLMFLHFRAVSYSEPATPEYIAPTFCFFDEEYSPEPATASSASSADRRNRRCQRVHKKNTPCSLREQGGEGSQGDKGGRNSSCWGERTETRHPTRAPR